jgi:eukaryotic-like serine/threonine-protein kinase
VLIYAPPGGGTTLSWFDRTGRNVAQLAPSGNYEMPRLSPDGTRVLFSQPDSRNGNRDLWSFNILSGSATRLTLNPANDWLAAWSPDGRQIFFVSDRLGGPDNRLFLKRTLEAGVDEELIQNDIPEKNASPSDWSPGGWMALCLNTNRTRSEVWLLNAATHRAFRFLPPTFNSSLPRFSPDEKWIAYVSDETGHSEVYVRPFHGAPAGSEERMQVSISGGDYPAWSRTGDELFYIASDLTLKSFDLSHPGPNRPTQTTLCKVCPATALPARPGNLNPWQHPYDVAADGRFLFNCLTEPPDQHIVWVNWR